MPADFDAVCAQLSTPQLDAAARIEGVVWGLVKGYTSWPGQIMDASVVSQDPEMQSAKPKRGSGHKAVQFFGDISKSWLTEQNMVEWSDGCARGFLKPPKNNKGLPPAILQVHTFLHTGALPKGWWQKAPKVPPIKRAAAGGAAGAPKKLVPEANVGKAAADAGEQQQEQQAKKQRTVVKGEAGQQPAAGLGDEEMLAADAQAAFMAPHAAPAAAGGLAADGTAAGAAGAARPAGSGSTSTRDMLRSVFNRIKLLHPAAARLETPNSVVDLLAALRKHFGPAMALATEQLRGKDANDLLAALFTWAAGKAISPAQVEACFPMVPHGKVQMPYALWDRITELGLYPLHWQLPLTKQQVDAGQRDGVAGLPAPHAAPACRVAAPGSAGVAAAATAAVLGGPAKKRRAGGGAGAGAGGEMKCLSEPRPVRGAVKREAQEMDQCDHQHSPRPVRRHSAMAPPSRFALESGAGGPALAAAERPSSPSLTAEEAASSQRARAAGRGPGLPVLDGRIVKPRPGSGWPGPSPEGFEEGEVPALVGRNSLPGYLHVRQNVWVSRPRPKRLLRDDIPVCNCHAPVGPSISSRRAALDEQLAQRHMVSWQQQQQAAAQLAAEQQLLVLPPPPLPPLAAITAAGATPDTPPAVSPQPAFQSVPQQAAIAVVPASGDAIAAAAACGGSPDGSAKKRVRRTDWEGRKCDWCGVTETSNWRRHPDVRDMLLCNQCGGYVRKHGKLSQERREKVAAQQVALALTSGISQAAAAVPVSHGPGASAATTAIAHSLGNSSGNGTGSSMLPLFQPAPLAMPPPPPMPLPLPSVGAPADPPWGQQQQQQQQQAAAGGTGMDVNAAPKAVGQAALKSFPAAEAVAPDRREASRGAAQAEAQHQQQEQGHQQQKQQQAQQLDPEDVAAAAVLVAALFAPWRQQLAALREERQVVAALVDAVFAPYRQPQQQQQQGQPAQPAPSAAVEVKEEVMMEPLSGPAAAYTAQQQQQQPAAVLVKQQPPGEQSYDDKLLALPQLAAAQQHAPAAAAAPPLPTRTGSSGLRRAAAAASAAAAAPQVGCGDSCLNRLSFIHCDRATCPCGDRCTNRPFVELAQPPMEVYLTPDKGWGVRCTAFVPRGTFIVEYAGEVIDDKECGRRAEEAKAANEPHFYMMELGPGLIIDARSKGNLARLLNSSCDPNCETQKWHDAGNSEVRVGIFSLRDILPGEELTYDYQFQHFGLAAAAGAYRCKCGAPNCRGTMDTQPERTRDFGRRLDVWWPAERRYFRGTITAYSSSQQRHTVRYDDGDQGRVFLPAEKYRWVDEHGHVVGDTHEPEVGAQAAARGNGGKKRNNGGGGGGGGGASEGSTASGAGGKRQRQQQPAAELLLSGNGTGSGSIASDAVELRRAGEGAAAQGTAAGAVKAAPPAADEAVPVNGAVPAVLPQQQQQQQPLGAACTKEASPGKVLDTYAHFNLAAQQQQQQPQGSGGNGGGGGGNPSASWVLPLPAGAPAPQLDIPGLKVNAMPSSLLPPPAQAGPLPEAPPLDTTSPLSATAVAPAFNPFNDLSRLNGLTAEQQQALCAFGQALGSPKALAGQLQLNGSLMQQEAKQQVAQQARQEQTQEQAGAVQPAARGACQLPASAVQQQQQQQQLRDPGLVAVSGTVGHRQLRDPSLKPVSGTIGHRRGRGNGQPALGDAEVVRPKRTVRRPARRFDDDYEGQEVDSDEDYVPSEHEEPSSPPRVSAPSRARLAATLSPATLAAVTMATLLGTGGAPGLPPVLPAVVGRAAPPRKRDDDSDAPEDDVEKDPDVTPEGLSTRSTQRRQPQAPLPVHVPATAAAPPGAPRPGGNRRNLPTPASTGLPARTILVAKRLTNSDVSKGRILLPRAAVEANLSFAIGKAHSLIARDHQQHTWQFTLQSWANGSRAGMESRRVYVLEHAGDFVRAHALKPDDVIGLSTSDEGAFLVEYNTEEVLAASENLAGARFGHTAPTIAAGSLRPAANMLIQQNAGRCARSEHCTKPAGHPGFCVRTHAAAAAAAARKARQANAAAAAAAANSSPDAAVATAPSTDNGPARAAAMVGSGRAGAPRVLGGGGGLVMMAAELAGVKRAPEPPQLFEGDHGAEEGRPKRIRKPTEKSATLDDSDDDYLAAAAATADALAEAAADSDMSDGEAEAPLMHPTFFQLKAKPPAGALPPAQPPVPGPNVPPIFVMAPDPSAGPLHGGPSHLRSPLRPSLSLQHMSSLHSSGSLQLHHSASAPLHLGPGPLHPHSHHHPHHHQQQHHHAHPHHHHHQQQQQQQQQQHVPHSGAGMPPHPPTSLPLSGGLGAPIQPPASLPQALPLSVPGSLPPSTAAMQVQPRPAGLPAQPAAHQQRGAQPQQQQQAQQQAQHGSGSLAGTPAPHTADLADYLAGSSPDDERKQQLPQQQQQRAAAQPPRPSPPPGQQHPRPQQQQQQQQQQARPPFLGPGQQHPRPALHSMRPPQQQQQHGGPRPSLAPGQQPPRPMPLPMPGMQLPPRPGMQQQQPRPGMQQALRPGMQPPPRPGMQHQPLPRVLQGAPPPRPLPGAALPRPGAPPQRPVQPGGPLGPLARPGSQQPQHRPMLAPRPGAGPVRPPVLGGGGGRGMPRPLMPQGGRPPAMPPAAGAAAAGAAAGPKAGSVAQAQMRPPPPLPVGGTSYLPSRPAGAAGPPPLFGGAPPAVAPGVGPPLYLPHHLHHHLPHMPPPPPAPEFDVGAFLSAE